MFNRNETTELQIRAMMRRAARKLDGADRRIVLDALDNDDLVGAVGDAMTIKARDAVKAPGDHPILEMIVAMIKDFIEHPEKLVNLIKTLAPLFVTI